MNEWHTQGPGGGLSSNGKWSSAASGSATAPTAPSLARRTNVPATALSPHVVNESTHRRAALQSSVTSRAPRERSNLKVRDTSQQPYGKSYAPELRPNDTRRVLTGGKPRRQVVRPMFHPHNYRPPTQSPPRPRRRRGRCTTAERYAAPTSSAASVRSHRREHKARRRRSADPVFVWDSDTMDSPGDPPTKGIGTPPPNEAASRQVLVSDGS